VNCKLFSSFFSSKEISDKSGDSSPDFYGVKVSQTLNLIFGACQNITKNEIQSSFCALNDSCTEHSDLEFIQFRAIEFRKYLIDSMVLTVKSRESDTKSQIKC